MDILADLDSDFEELENLGVRIRMRRRFKPHPDYLNILNDSEFHCRFRLSKQAFRNLLNEIKVRLEPKTNR